MGINADIFTGILFREGGKLLLWLAGGVLFSRFLESLHDVDDIQDSKMSLVVILSGTLFPLMQPGGAIASRAVFNRFRKPWLMAFFFLMAPFFNIPFVYLLIREHGFTDVTITVLLAALIISGLSAWILAPVSPEDFIRESVARRKKTVSLRTNILQIALIFLVAGLVRASLDPESIINGDGSIRDVAALIGYVFVSGADPVTILFQSGSSPVFAGSGALVVTILASGLLNPFGMGVVLRTIKARYVAITFLTSLVGVLISGALLGGLL